MIELKNISKYYKIRNTGEKFTAIDNINLEIEKGKITALFGPNASGKTTLMKLISGIVKPDIGDIYIDSKKITTDMYNVLAFIPSDDNYPFSDNIKNTFNMMSFFYKKWDMEKAYRMTSLFGLSMNDSVEKLSKGNKSKLKIIMGFCQYADYLLLDEPFSGIDFIVKDEIISILSEYMREDQAIIITSHDIEEIENIIDEAVFMKDGKIISKINAEELRENEGISLAEKSRELYINEY